MIMYYHMFGVDIGELNVYVRFYSNGPLQKIYGVSGNSRETKKNISFSFM